MIVAAAARTSSLRVATWMMKISKMMAVDELKCRAAVPANDVPCLPTLPSDYSQTMNAPGSSISPMCMPCKAPARSEGLEKLGQ